MITEKSFASENLMAGRVAELLRLYAVKASEGGPQAIMLSGGRTPLAAYKRLEEVPATAAETTRVFLSDERMVPTDSPENNFSHISSMLRALEIPPERAIRVDTARSTAEATEKFHADLEAFFQAGGRIPLGLLGLGADGHTASLFAKGEIARGQGRYAQAVPRAEGPDRVSVTRDLLKRVERIIFLTAGAEKTAIIQQLLKSPTSLPAGLAVDGLSNVELWTSA